MENFDRKEGIKLSYVKKQIIKNKFDFVEINKKIVIKDSNKLCKFLFGKNISWKDIESFEKLYDLYKSDKFKFKLFREIIDQNFKIILDKKNLKMY